MANEFIGSGILSQIANPVLADTSGIMSGLIGLGDRRRAQENLQSQQQVIASQQQQEQQLLQQQNTIKQIGSQAIGIRNLPPQQRGAALIELGNIKRNEGDEAGFQEAIRLANMSESAQAAELDADIAAASEFLKLGSAAAGRPVDDTARQESAEIRKETRGGIRKDVGRLSQEAGTIESNFKKVQNLAKEIGKGNRISVTQALVGLVKLGDPGSVVSGKEVGDALNQESPLAAFAQLMTSKGVDNNITQSILSRIDAKNPDNIKVEDLLSTADALVSANVPAIQQRFAEAQELGGQLTEKGRSSLFTKALTNRISGLSNLKPAPVEGQQPRAAAAQATSSNQPVNQQALEWANNNPNDPRAAAIKQRLGVR